MFIDILVAIALVFATVKGIRNGLIIAVFSILAFIIGLAAALKLSTVVASWLAQSTNINVQWLPFLAFALVFLLVVLAVRSVAKLIEKAMDLAWMGWLNKLGGVLIYACMYLLILSVLFFYGTQLKLITEEARTTSVAYTYIAPVGPKVIEMIGVVIPIFSNMFSELQQFFEKLGTELKPQ
jgi:membrane protein required for colicin V production